jgi:hypothetical protein
MKTDMTLFTPRGGSGGGAGGTSLKWEESVDAPPRDISNGVGIYEYQQDTTNKLYTAIRVPSSYVAGNQISLKILFYSADNTGTVLMQSVATLIRAETDSIASIVNQRTSTNAAVTLAAGTVNEPQKVTLDLTSATGTINSVAVSAGDLILVALQRADSDTSTAAAYFVEQSAEATFQ